MPSGTLSPGTSRTLDTFPIMDVPVPSGGFADPATWEEPSRGVRT